MATSLTRDGFFPTTIWSQIRIASDREDVSQSDQLDCVLQKYLPVLGHYLRVSGRVPVGEIDDLLQAFVLEKVIVKNFLGQADRNKGKFRSFLIRSLDNFISNQMRDQQRRFGHIKKPLTEVEFENTAGPMGLNPAHQFDVIWGRRVIGEALERMRLGCLERQREDMWRVFEGRVVRPVFEGVEPMSYGQLVEAHGYETPKQACNTLVNGKRMFAAALRQILEEYNLNHQAVESDLDEIREAFASGTQAPGAGFERLVEEGTA